MRRFVILLLAAGLLSWAWGACHENGVRVGGCSDSPTTDDACATYGSSYQYCVNTGVSCNNTAMCGGAGIPIWCATYVYCTTQAEADSVKCHRYPTAAGCIQEKDTTLYYCKQEYSTGSQSWKSYIFKCGCKQAGGTITSCNGKQNVDVMEDCTPYRALDGDCAQNGYDSGPNAAKDSTGGNADCFAVIGSTCHMKDRASGNTFTCECDGSCQYAVRKMASGECVNPYPQPEETGDTLQLPPPSSSSWEPPASSSTEDIGESFGNELEGLSGLYGVLDTIRDTLVHSVSPNVAAIRANTQTANTYLQQIANKNWSVNVEAPNVNVENNTDVSGIQSRQDRQYSADTAYQRQVLGALGALGDTSGAGNPNDTAGSGAALQSRLDKIDSAVSAYDVPDMSDSIPSAVAAVRGKVSAMRDSITNGPMGDSVNAWSDAFLNNGVLTGSGSNTCPSALTRQVQYTFPHVGTINAGSLGAYLCTPVAGLSVTLWQVARMLMRALVAIGCMWWLFKEVTGTQGGGSDED